MDSFLTPYALSNSGEDWLQFTPFWGGSKPCSSDGLCTGTIESHKFFVLGPILVKFHIRTRLIESFRTIFRTWWCGEEKLHFPPFHTLHQLKRDEALFPPVHNKVAMYAVSQVLSCWKLHISTQLIDSFPLTYGMRRCALEKLWIPLDADHKA